MEQLLPYLKFNEIEIIGLAILLVLLLVQLYYYISYYNKPLKNIPKGAEEEIGIWGRDSYPRVSVVIESENEAAHLEANLPLILDQDYPNFEVVVVNKGSTDESDAVLQALKAGHSHLYHTYIPHSYDKSLSTRKLAMTVGIKAAKGDIVLFTEPYSRPVSNKWISLMVEQLKDGKEIALGYSYYTETPHFYNRMARFDNHLFSMQYLSMALRNKPFTGVYRNIAYKKSLFFDNKGFASCLGMKRGEEVFINQILTSNNAAVILDQDSFIETELSSYPLWKQIKSGYSFARSNFKGFASRVFYFEYFTRYLFYAFFLALVVFALITQSWIVLGLSILFFLIRSITQFVLLKKSTAYFHSGKFHFSLLTLDFLQPIYNLRFRSRQTKTKF